MGRAKNKLLRYTADNPNCITYKFFLVTKSCVATASFLGVTAISVDSFLAVHLHLSIVNRYDNYDLRYQELVTTKRVIAVATLIQLFSASVSLTLFWVELDKNDVFFPNV